MSCQSICINGVRITLGYYFLKNVAEESTRVLYSLYGVVEHSGTMRSGHYTAYTKARTASSRLSNLVLRGDIPQGKIFHKLSWIAETLCRLCQSQNDLPQSFLLCS